jgi:hypothetical protein
VPGGASDDMRSHHFKTKIGVWPSKIGGLWGFRYHSFKHIFSALKDMGINLMNDGWLMTF